jgi:CubicO group peptidase (beta-lactamase class C family)
MGYVRRNARVFILSPALLILLGACGPLPERGAASATPFIPDRLLRLDAAIQKSIDDGEIPGAVALIAHQGETVYHKTFGYRDIEQRTPMTRDTVFRIASMSKAITSIGVMILYERGHFLLSDPISDYLPEFEKPRVLVKADGQGKVLETKEAAREITIIDLLTHSSGISYPFIDNELQAVYKNAGVIDGVTERPLRLEEQMKILAQQPLLHDPGEKFSYGLSTDLLGYFCEVISGKPFGRFLADEIFMPLGMSDTSFYLPEEKADRLATLYAVDDDGVLHVAKGDESSIFLDNPRYPIEGAKTYHSGGAGLSSTTRDYARFLQMLLSNGELEGTRILGRKSVEFLTSPRLKLEEDGVPKMSAAFYVAGSPGEEGGLTSAGAYSWGGAFYTTYFIDPREEMLGVFMSQGLPISSSISDRFKVLVYQALQ